jgi:outer membrane lipoprotein-sorting protein
MRSIIVLVVIAALAGCGVETATTAATVAAAKQKEIEQGKKTMNQVQQNLDKAMEQTQQSAERADAAAK